MRDAKEKGSLAWCAADFRSLLPGGSAGLLQLMHPALGHAVMEHSAFAQDPFGRVYRSIPQIWATILTPEDDARVHHPHEYHALDPDTFWWAHATFTWQMFRSKSKSTQELRRQTGKCTHIYFYVIDPQFGWSHVRVQTWMPYTVQICINGREWLERQLDAAGLEFRRADNCFSLGCEQEHEKKCDSIPRACEVHERAAGRVGSHGRGPRGPPASCATADTPGSNQATLSLEPPGG